MYLVVKHNAVTLSCFVDVILEGSDYSSDDGSESPRPSRDHKGNPGKVIVNYEPRSDPLKAVHSSDSGYHQDREHGKRRQTGNGRKHGITKYNLPLNLTDEVDQDRSSQRASSTVHQGMQTMYIIGPIL